MQSVTITLDEDLVQRARIAATVKGQSLSRFIRETVERQVGRPVPRSERIAQSLAGPPLNLPDETARAPTRDQTTE